ncbi:hypothetical protein ES332_A03G008700v1 [Gossypium tomentosum]|uniref:Methyltransferase n=1 Tax=Gossypium tomentosum TaxID=34277 RepID=A0A5D2R4L8_GOSTO|nr:hypothetical protein ES332_A03G008700v1 [Gossypium tomentosum]
MSFAPWDNHEAQVQFALERRVPAVIGVLGSSRALDMPRRSRCLVPWTSNGKWYTKMETCITPFPKVSSASKVACGKLEKFPARPFAVPSWITEGLVESYQEDNKLSKKHVNAYKWIDKLIGTTRYRNVMDMNAGLGGFAATPESPKQCEGFSTYSGIYDLIHANGVFSLYENKCKFEDMLLEMDQTLRSEGAVIFRDDVDVINKVSSIAKGMRWNIKMVDDEDEGGPLVTEKILVAVEQYWVGSNGGNSTVNDE